MKKYLYIFVMLLSIVALQAAGQGYIIDKICLGTIRNYRVEGEAGSTYNWFLTNELGANVPLDNPLGKPINPPGIPPYGNEVSIEWKKPGVYNLLVIENSILGCDTLEQGTLEVFEQPVAIAGNPLNICSDAKVYLTSSFVDHNSSLLWTSSGDGTFDDPLSLHTAYNIGPNDLIKGDVKLTLTAQGLNSSATCIPATSTLLVTFLIAPKLVIHDPPEVCLPQTVDLSASSITAGSDPVTFEYFKDISATIELTNYKTVDESDTYYIRATSILTGCAVIKPVMVTFSKQTVPNFAPFPEVCLNSTNPPSLPPSDLLGIGGTWSYKDLSNNWVSISSIITNTSGTFEYKFLATPKPGECYKDTTLLVTISSSITPKFNIFASQCLGSSEIVLPTVSLNGITGTWDKPKILTSSIGTTNYKFTPDAGGCGVPFNLPVTITTPASPPTFGFNKILCLNETPPDLPNVSLEGVSGSWSPATISTNTLGPKTYVFTPFSQCVQPRFESIQVIDKTTPDFDPIGPLCFNSATVILPSTSKNGISGTWTPAVVSTNLSGTFNFTFVPLAGSCAVNTTMQIEIYNDIVVKAVFDPILVSGGTTTVIVTATGGSGIYTSGTGSLTLSSGLHSFTVSDNAGCEGKVTIFIPEPHDIAIAESHTAILCKGGVSFVTITASGGTPPYRYFRDGTLLASNTDMLPASPNPYWFEVFDSNGLTSERIPVTITEPAVMTLTASATSPSCLGGTNGTATAIALGGTGTINYLWNDPLKQTTATAFGLNAGDYIVTATDACGSQSFSVKVLDPPAIALAALGIASQCPGSDGSIQFTTTNIPDGTYTVTYTSGQFNSVVFSGGNATVSAPVGTYANLQINYNNCSTSGVNAIVGPATVLTVVLFWQQPTCLSPASVTVTNPKVNGYVYILDNTIEQSTPTFVGLSEGPHTVKIRQSSGCETLPGSFVINPAPIIPVAPIVSVTKQPDCTITTGTIEVTIPAPASGITYSLKGISPAVAVKTNTTGVFTGLTPGLYDVTYAYPTGCASSSKSLTINVSPAPPIQPTAYVSLAPRCIDSSGEITVLSPLGPNYLYSIDGGSYTSSVTFSNQIPGNHFIKVKDILTTCESTVSLPITVPNIPPVPHIISLTTENCICYDGLGKLNFEFQNITDGNYIIIYVDGQLVSGKFENVEVKNNKASVFAKAGTYNVLAIEANGCTSPEKGWSVTIEQPDEISVSATITEIDLKSKQKGEINLTITGGTVGPNGYQTIWQPNPINGFVGATSEDIKNLDAGLYVVSIIDANGCPKIFSETIPKANMPPTATNDEFNTGCGSVVGNLLYADNGNGIDSDPDGDLIAIDTTPVGTPLHGTLTLNPDGTFEYKANPGYTGDDSFRYVIYDIKKNFSIPAIVTIHAIADFDCDGFADLVDDDADGDGILNVDEGGIVLDSDGDGHPNWLDIDDDNDGIVDNIEAQLYLTGYIAPSGKHTDYDGLDDIYDTDQNGTNLTPLDSDNDGIPDFLDADSDNDGVPDYIEGHDPDADGKPNYLISGKDFDDDGLDDVWDMVNRFTLPYENMTGSNSPLQDFDGDGLNDWRDENDDDDEYLTRFEDLNMDGDFSNDDTDRDGHPEYLDYGRDCDLFIPNAFSPNDDNIHDFFQIYCIDHFPNARMYIFDQLGNKVYEQYNYGNLDAWGTPDRAWWDGRTTNRAAETTSGGKVAPGTYYYVLQLGNGEVKKSFVFVSY